MSLEAILAKIKGDAESEARKIVKHAEAEKKKAEVHHAKRLKDRHKRYKDRMSSKITDMEKRKEYHVRREAEKRLLNARRTLMDEAIQRAVDNLAIEDDKEYLELISSLMGRCNLTGEVEVIISNRDQSRISAEFLRDHSSAGTTFVLSEQRHDESGGVIFRTGNISQNGTFAMIAELSHEELIMELSGILPLEKD